MAAVLVERMVCPVSDESKGHAELLLPTAEAVDNVELHASVQIVDRRSRFVKKDLMSRSTLSL